MERHIITLDERSTLHVPEAPDTSIWMDEPELVELFGVIAPTLRAAVKAVYKSGIVTPHETERAHKPARREQAGGVQPLPDSRPRFPPRYLRGPATAGICHRQIRRRRQRRKRDAIAHHAKHPAYGLRMKG